MKYRSEIDGLRALAVVPVILSHAGFEFLKGGFVGVDLFFVISGYLITTLIIEELDNKEFNLVKFYERRLRRIFPALFVVIFFSSLFAWCLLPSPALNKYGDAIIGVSLFISNIVFWRQHGYFEESSDVSPLIHTWSLAVEEQFYLIFPIFLLIFWSLGKKKIFLLITIIALISLLLSEWGWRNKPIPNFYLLPTRAWELLMGSITALIILKKGQQKNQFLSFVGLAAIIFSYLNFDSSTPFPSIYTLIPVIGIILVIIFCNNETLLSKILKNKTIVMIGLVSYSAYLWHQPIFAFARLFLNSLSLDTHIRFFLVFLNFIIAFISWRFIEKPFRNKNFLNSKIFFFIISLSLSFTILIGYFSKIAVKGYEYDLAKTLSKNDYIYFQNMDERKFINGRLMYDLKDVNIIVVGSSRVMQINSSIFNEPIYNLSISLSSIKDNFAVSLEAAAKISPKYVFVSADPWLLDKHYSATFSKEDKLFLYWKDRIKNNNEMIPYFSNKKNVYKHHFLSNPLRNLRDIAYRTKIATPKSANAEIYDKKTHDGFHIYNLDTEKKSIDDSSLRRYDFMKNFIYNHDAENILHDLIFYFKNNNIKIILLLTPYHPDQYNIMRKEKNSIIDIENNFKRIAKKNKIKIVGSYNPFKVGCYKDEFYDSAHPKHKCMSKIFKFDN